MRGTSGPGRTLRLLSQRSHAWTSLIAPFLNGTADGALLLIAPRPRATFGQMGVINMAHGEFLMAGAYSAYLTQQVVTNTNVSILLALPVAFLVAGLLGLLLEVDADPVDVSPAAGHTAGHRSA